MQLCWRAVEDWCKALRSSFLTDHSAHVSYIVGGLFLPSSCFLCVLFSHRGIFIDTDSSLCFSSNSAFVPSLGSPLALSQTQPKCFKFCLWNPSLQELENVTASGMGLGNPKHWVSIQSWETLSMGCLFSPVLKIFLSASPNLLDYSSFVSGWERSKTGWLMSLFQCRVSRLSCLYPTSPSMDYLKHMEMLIILLTE